MDSDSDHVSENEKSRSSRNGNASWSSANNKTLNTPKSINSNSGSDEETFHVKPMRRKKQYRIIDSDSDDNSNDHENEDDDSVSGAENNTKNGYSFDSMKDDSQENEEESFTSQESDVDKSKSHTESMVDSVTSFAGDLEKNNDEHSVSHTKKRLSTGSMKETSYEVKEESFASQGSNADQSFNKSKSHTGNDVVSESMVDSSINDEEIEENDDEHPVNGTTNETKNSLPSDSMKDESHEESFKSQGSDKPMNKSKSHRESNVLLESMMDSFTNLASDCEKTHLNEVS